MPSGPAGLKINWEIETIPSPGNREPIRGWLLARSPKIGSVTRNRKPVAEKTQGLPPSAGEPCDARAYPGLELLDKVADVSDGFLVGPGLRSRASSLSRPRHATAIIALHRRTRDRAIGAEHAAVASEGLKPRPAALAVIEEHAGIGRHRLDGPMTA
jgi:hypothetical protein